LVRERDFTLPATQRVQLSQLLLTIERVRADTTLTDDSKVAQITSLPNASVVLSPTVAAAVLTLDSEAWNNLRFQTLDMYDRSMGRYDYDISAEALVQLLDRDIPYWTSGMPLRQRELLFYFMRSFLRANSTLDLEATAAKKKAARDAVPSRRARAWCARATRCAARRSRSWRRWASRSSR
jgi:hypothetical protein